MFKFTGALLAVAVLAGPAAAQAPDLDGFRSLYKELVETNTTSSAGSCTLAAERMSARLKAAGFPDADLHILVPPDHPKDGNLVAVYPGRDARAKAVLLLAHLDVVEAKREDWTRDPFTLIEEGGYFYARGSSDDKAQAAIFTDLLIRYRKEGYRPRRTLKLALTCGEEGGGSYNGATWLSKEHRQLIDAGLALNEGAGGQLDAAGKPTIHTVLAAEKTSRSYNLEATNPGGHSSRPSPDNAIYHVIRAVDRISRYEFPVQLNDANRGYLVRMAPILGGEQGAAMTALVANPKDARADALLSRDDSLHAMLRTTCVATMLEAGHAPNALPQRARATINCRIFPGVQPAEVQAQLAKLVDDPAVSVKLRDPRDDDERQLPPGPPLTPAVLGPIETVSAQMWPGVPVIPILQPAATDAKALNDVGIPTYGVSGIFYDADLGRIHGLNERIRVKSLYDAREFTWRLVKVYADQK